MKSNVFFVVSFLLMIASCERAPEEIAVASVSLSQPTAEMLIGEKIQLHVSISPSNATDKNVLWASSKKSVASVSGEGWVVAIDEGNSTITATVGGKSATCQVTVTKGYVAVSSVTLSKTKLTLTEGESERLTAAVRPDDASEKSVTWSSSAPEIVLVEDGNVTGLKEGVATITATAGEKLAKCEVTVNKKVIQVSSVTLSTTSLALNKGESDVLVATVLPEDATDKTVTWSSSKTHVVSVDQNGLVHAVGGGSAVISANAGDITATCSVTVTVPVESITLSESTLTLEKWQTATLTATVYPNDATNKTVIWSSSNSSVAKMSGNKVTALDEGDAIITASIGDVAVSCQVTVTRPYTYFKWIGGWSVNKGGGTEIWTIVANEEGKNYKVLGLDGQYQYPLLAAYNPDTGGFSISTQDNLGTGTVSTSSGDVTGPVGVYGEVEYQGEKYVITGDYTIVVATLNGEENGTLTPVTINVNNMGNMKLSSLSYYILSGTRGFRFVTSYTQLPNTMNRIHASLNPIVFSDSRIKEKLVACFDTNGDGELSYLEALSVTSLAGVFGDETSYSSFDEFQYFTNVTSIPNGMFEGWELTSIILPDKLSAIPAYAFRNCNALSSITLPVSIRGIGMNAFENCARLSSISIPENVTEVGRSAFYRCVDLTQVTMPLKIKTIDVSCFRECLSLESIVIPEGVVKIDQYAFRDCKSLKEISFPNSLQTIVYGAFLSCYSQASGGKKIVIHKNIKSIEEIAFRDFRPESITIEAIIVPTGGANMFSYSYPIYVPAESLDAYKTAPYWSEYADRIKPIEE